MFPGTVANWLGTACVRALMLFASRAGWLQLNCPAQAVPIVCRLTELGIEWESTNWHSAVLGNVLAAF